MARQTRPDGVAALALLNEPKRRRLYELVVSRTAPVGRDEAAAALGMSRELVAFHLDQLVAAGLLETEYRRLGERRGRGGGRPAKLYRGSAREVSVSVPPREYLRAAEVFARALEGLPFGAGARAAAEAGRATGRKAGVAAREAAGRAEHQPLTKTLLDLLDAAGFAPVFDSAGAVRLCNCPYRALSAEHRDLTCGVNLAWAEGVVDGLGDERVSVTSEPIDNRCCVAFHGIAADA